MYVFLLFSYLVMLFYPGVAHQFLSEEHFITYFQKVLICIKKGLSSVYFKEMKILTNSFFEKGVLLFSSFSQIGEEKEHFFQ